MFEHTNLNVGSCLERLALLTGAMSSLEWFCREKRPGGDTGAELEENLGFS